MKFRGSGFKVKTKPENAKPVSLARISYSNDGETAVCSCGGWSFTHRRRKVLEDAIDRHFFRRHRGQGIRL